MGGTGGTITGAGQVLKAARPGIRIIATEPESAALLGGKEWQPHKIQGWTPDFIPAVLDRSVIDQVITVTDAEWVECSRNLAQREGIFCGISAGGDVRGGAQDRGASLKGKPYPGDAAGYGRAVLQHGLVRGGGGGVGRDHAVRAGFPRSRNVSRNPATNPPTCAM